MKSKPVIFFVPIPLFKFDNKVNRLCILNTLYTKQCLDINDTDTTKFNKMTGNIRCRSDQSNVTDFTKFYDIITYKTMTTLDQFQSGLALADSALTCNQDSFTINIDKYTMNGDTWCKLYTKPADDFSHKTGCCPLCHKCRYIIFDRHVDHILRRLCHGAENNARNLTGNKTLIFHHTLLITELHQIRIFYISNDLNTLICKMFQISGKLQCRSVDLCCHDSHIRQINLRSQICKIQLLYHLCHQYTFHNVFSFNVMFIYSGEKNHTPVLRFPYSWIRFLPVLLQTHPEFPLWSGTGASVLSFCAHQFPECHPISSAPVLYFAVTDDILSQSDGLHPESW